MCNAALDEPYMNSLNSIAQTPSPSSLCPLPVGSFSTALQQARYFIYNTEVYAWTYLQARRGFWLERVGFFFFFWNKELENSCLELAVVALYGLRCQFSCAQPLMGAGKCFAERVSGSPLRCDLLVKRLCISQEGLGMHASCSMYETKHLIEVEVSEWERIVFFSNHFLLCPGYSWVGFFHPLFLIFFKSFP